MTRYQMGTVRAAVVASALLAPAGLQAEIYQY